jgi:hypothetical protein
MGEMPPNNHPHDESDGNYNQCIEKRLPKTAAEGVIRIRLIEGGNKRKKQQ